ncbi:hypothetical protein [Nocardioides sp. R-C-SC26]|uniref:hypothetical protein n=1 Tax=Nocardioides sp. R-C-SC26 TaxID=2870414 RepID=UPI001E4E8422|nr:hypothetical protein [Nocardioides sp. R-C-SC26]
MSRRTRPLAIAALGGLTAAGLTVVGTATTGAMAAEVTRTVNFRDCEVRKFPAAQNIRVADNLPWSPTVRLNHPSPIPAEQDVTTEVDLGVFPAGYIPETVVDAQIYVLFRFENQIVSRLDFYRTFPAATYDPSQPFDIPEIEQETRWGAGIYPQRPTLVEVWFTGTDQQGEFLEYKFACDAAFGEPSFFDVAVYDLAAPAEIRLDTYALRQGQRVRVTAFNLLTEAPTTPPAQAVVTIGGISVARVPIDASGKVDAVVTVPPYLRPGNTQVRITNGTKTAAVQAAVSAVGGSVKVTKKVKSGKKVAISGTRFRPGEQVRIAVRGGAGKGSKAFSSVARVRADGSFTASIKLKKAARGAWSVAVAGATSGRSARSSFLVR